jgi:hypothetical protein
MRRRAPPAPSTSSVDRSAAAEAVWVPAPRFVVTAVAGIVMATAAQVTATDLEHCMRVICENIRANALPLAAASSGAITAEELWWGDVPRTTSCKDGFDYVIAADVVRDLRDAVGRARTCCATELCGASSAVGML